MNSSLSTRLILLLTVALLPIGMIAVYQTHIVVQEASELNQRDILARTSDAANAELALIREAIGAAEALGTTALEVGLDSPACTRITQRFVENHAQFAFAGVLQASGIMDCSSGGTQIDFSQTDEWAAYVQDPRQRINISREGAVSGRSVMIISVPIFDEAGAMRGASSISIPHSLADTLLSGQVEDVIVSILDGAGTIISSSTGIDDTDRIDYLEIVPADLDIPLTGRTIDTVGIDGNNATLGIVPLNGTDLFVIGKWSNDAQPLSVSFLGTAAPAFPILMWLASLCVAYLAVDRLVFRPLLKLRRRMARFSPDNMRDGIVLLPNAPAEIGEIAQSYNALVERVASEHDMLEASLHEKELLLKEVHHRVKNNLQLIASILNMQLRALKSPEAQRVLRRVQDRVMSLATIHKSLYNDARVDAVRVDRLLDQIVNGIMNMGTDRAAHIQTRFDFHPVELDPDQAVPLTLLVTEAMTNALKYAGADGDAAPAITASLVEGDDNRVSFELVNSRGAHGVTPQEEEDGTGLGNKLITAFVSQLGGDMDTRETEGDYTLAVTFTKFAPDADTDG